MPSITVSDEVLRRIRSLREAGEETEDEILARVLAVAESDKEDRLRAYRAGHPVDQLRVGDQLIQYRHPGQAAPPRGTGVHVAA